MKTRMKNHKNERNNNWNKEIISAINEREDYRGKERKEGSNEVMR